MDDMKAALGYVRVSTDEQAKEGVSLDAQEQSIRAYAMLRGLRLVKIFREEGVSGGIPLAERPQGRMLVAAMEKRSGPRHVIAVKLDRLFRSAADALNHSAAWRKTKRTLHFTDMNGNAVDTSTAMGQMFFTLLAGFAEMEKNLIGER